jgi:hypothetical protein
LAKETKALLLRRTREFKDNKALLLRRIREFKEEPFSRKLRKFIWRRRIRHSC